MKKKNVYGLIVGMLLLSVSLFGDVSGQGQKGTVGAMDKKYLKAAGWSMGNQSIESAVGQFGLNPEEKWAMMDGIISGASGEKNPIDVKVEGQAMLDYLENRIETQVTMRQEQITKDTEMNKRRATGYFGNLKRNPNIKMTSSGLFYEILKAGVGLKPVASSTVTIDYVGKLIDGTEFDSSLKRGEPATFSLEHVIPGFREGLQLVGKGGKIRLHVPSELGYGDTPLPNIPPGSVLIFEVDVIDVKSS